MRWLWGVFVLGQIVDDLYCGGYFSRQRNRQIARIFKEAGLIEAYGSGISRVLRGGNKAGLPEPELNSYSDISQWVIYKKGAKKTTPKLIFEIDVSLSLAVNILAYLGVNPEATRNDIARRFGVSIITVKEYILKLRKQDRLVRVGSLRSGYWPSEIKPVPTVLE